MKNLFNRYLLIFTGILCISFNSFAEDGYNLWLRYDKIKNRELCEQYQRNITEIVVPNNTGTFKIIRNELEGLSSLLNKKVKYTPNITQNGAVVVGTLKSLKHIASLDWNHELDKEGYIIRSAVVKGKKVTVIAATGEIGALYGSYHFLRLIQTHEPINALNIAQSPKIQRRFLNHWDNIFPTKYGTIERGYAGATLWKWNELPEKIDQRYRDYARANASIGINSIVINNVNSEPHILKTEYLKKAAALADIFRPYGITVYLTANYSAPMKPSNTPFTFKKWGGIGHLETADPLDPEVIKWWTDKIKEIYQYIPDFGGFLVKANSEGMPGPQDYGRTHAEGANMLAKILKPFGGIVMWRAFVYNPGIDSDRAKRAYKEFVPLDGQFESNVFVQPKNGPLDFQPREPVHPLFGAMPQTPLLMEFQITQEYLGESTYLVYLAPMWKETLAFDTFAKGKNSFVGRIIDGTLDNHAMSGMAGVANTGSDRNWCGHHFAQANWYAFGRLAWDHSLSSDQIAEEWIRMTWGNDDKIVQTIKSIMAGSWETAVNYMTPLGLNFTMDSQHYEPGHEQRNHKYWFADSQGLGYDRTRQGTGAVDQYFSPISDQFNDIETVPEKYITYFHKVDWDHEMKSGNTFWQELCRKYNSGVNDVEKMISQWQSIKPLIDNERYQHVWKKLEEQQSHAEKWRNKSLDFFQKFSNRPYDPTCESLVDKEAN